MSRFQSGRQDFVISSVRHAQFSCQTHKFSDTGGSLIVQKHTKGQPPGFVFQGLGNEAAAAPGNSCTLGESRTVRDSPQAQFETSRVATTELSRRLLDSVPAPAGVVCVVFADFPLEPFWYLFCRAWYWVELVFQ